MSNRNILNPKKSPNDNFESIVAATEDVLSRAMQPFLNYFLLDADGFLVIFKYDYNSLLVTTVYGLLDLLSITYSEGASQQKVVANMETADIHDRSEQDMNFKRLKRINDVYHKRNTQHLEYLNSTEYSPRLLVSDALWYTILSDYPMLKRILFDENPIITKHFFDDLNEIYEKINTYSGYDRFYLLHKLEMSSKLEMYYKILALIKKEKRRLKLKASDVDKMIEKMRDLHVVPYNHIALFDILECSDETEVFEEILGFPYGQKTINSLVFNVDRLIDCYIEDSGAAVSFIRGLNFIYYTTIFHLCLQIENESSLSADDFSSFNVIREIQRCEVATKFFDHYINSHILMNTSKKCGEDITFQHFKKVYGAKKETKRGAKLAAHSTDASSASRVDDRSC